MHSTRTLVIANWKMHLTAGQASLLSARMHKHIAGHKDIEVVIAPSTLSLQPLSHEIDRRRFRLAAQNAYHKDEGGFTGEVSFAMLRDLVHYVIIGHSERRIYFNESLEIVRDKVAACVRNGITPVLCIGETSAERRDGQTKQVLHDQVVSALSNLTAEDVGAMAIAYEPVWAIGTGLTPTLEQIEEVHRAVRAAMDFFKRDISDVTVFHDELDLAPFKVKVKVGSRVRVVGLGEGARGYLARTLVGGQVTDATVMLDIRPSDMAAGVLRDAQVGNRNDRQVERQLLPAGAVVRGHPAG